VSLSCGSRLSTKFVTHVTANACTLTVKTAKTGLRVETSVKKDFCFTVFVLKSCDAHFSGDAVEDQFLRERCMQSQEEQNRYILLASSQ
jgi:hypothetical protein